MVSSSQFDVCIPTGGPAITYDISIIDNIDDITSEQAIIIDDAAIFISDDQKSQWIEIKPFEFPYPAEDNELSRVANIIAKYYLKA